MCHRSKLSDIAQRSLNNLLNGKRGFWDLTTKYLNGSTFYIFLLQVTNPDSDRWKAGVLLLLVPNPQF